VTGTKWDTLLYEDGVFVEVKKIRFFLRLGQGKAKVCDVSHLSQPDFECKHWMGQCPAMGCDWDKRSTERSVHGQLK